MLTAGIDLGTNAGRIAVFSGFGTLQSVAGELSPSEFETPSVIVFQNRDCLVGAVANRQLEIDSRARALHWNKNLLGTFSPLGTDHFDRPWTAEGVAAVLIQKLRLDAEATGPGSLEFVVLATDVATTNEQRLGLLRSARLAGVQDAETVDEATAAATFLDLKSDDTDRHLVCDYALSGFKAAIVQRTPSGYRTLTSFKNNQLSIGRFRQLLMDRILEESERQLGRKLPVNSTTQAVLASTASRIFAANEGLGESARMFVPFGGQVIELAMDLGHLRPALQSASEQCADACERFLQRTESTWNNIGQIGMIGGGANIPQFRATLLRRSDKVSNATVLHQPLRATAFGAAILAAEWSKRKAGAGRTPRLVASKYEIGLRRLQGKTQQVAFDSLLPLGAKLPSRVVRVLAASPEKQSQLLLDIVRRSGEFAPLESALRLVVTSPRTAKHLRQIRVEFQFDDEGGVWADSYDESSNAELHCSIESGNLGSKPSPLDSKLINSINAIA